jgi:hypothetical protein
LIYGRFFRRPILQYDPEHAHSDYLELLAEYGLIGAVGMAVFIFAHIRSSLAAIQAVIKTSIDDPFRPFRDNRLAFQVGALCAFAAYLAHSVTDFNLHIPGNALMFAFFFGIAANPVAENPSATAPSPGLRFFQFALPALGVWIIVSGLAKFPGDYFTEKCRVAVRQRRYEEAIALGQRALQSETRNPFLYFHLGEANRALGLSMPLRTFNQPHFERAADRYRQALALFPQDETFWVRLGQSLDHLGQYRPAEAAYRQALELDPELSIIYNYYAAHLVAAGREEEAAQVLNERKRPPRENEWRSGAANALPADPTSPP